MISQYLPVHMDLLCDAMAVQESLTTTNRKINHIMLDGCIKIKHSTLNYQKTKDTNTIPLNGRSTHTQSK